MNTDFSKSHQVRHIDFKDLRADFQRDLSDLILQQNLKIKQNIETGEFHAYVQLENSSKQIHRSKSSQGLNIKRVAHPKYVDKQRILSAIKSNATSEKNKPKNTNASKNIKSGEFFRINLEKKNILQKFQPFFPNLIFSDYMSAPSLTPKVNFYQRMELIYNRQFEIILRSSKKLPLVLSNVVSNTFEVNSTQKTNFACQSLFNFLYTIAKNISHPEITLFANFLFERLSMDALYFYLYSRQIAKVITGHFFLYHKVNEINPKNIEIQKPTALKILEKIFYFDLQTANNAKKSFSRIFRDSKSIKYYEFLIFLMGLDIDHEVHLKEIRFVCQNSESLHR